MHLFYPVFDMLSIQNVLLRIFIMEKRVRGFSCRPRKIASPVCPLPCIEIRASPATGRLCDFNCLT